MFEEQKPISRMALKIGVAGFIGFGALATGLFVTRKGRHLVREAWQGRARTRLEDRVLDAIWDNARLARRKLDVAEVQEGHVELIGAVRSAAERDEAVRVAMSIKGVQVVIDALEVVPRKERIRRF